MKDDFDVIVRRFPRENITLHGIYDVHLGAPEHMHKAFKAFVDGVLQDPNSYIILGGDLINNATKSSVSNCYEEVMRPRDQKRVITELLKPLADNGRIIAAVTGNHERRSAKEVDNDITYDIMCKLDIEDLYRPNQAYVKLQFGQQRGDGNKNPTYRICATHGSGGGALTGGIVNKNNRFAMAIDGIDLMMVGHSHDPYTVVPKKIVFDPYHNRVTMKPFRVASMGSWLAYGGYAAYRLLSPRSSAEDAPQTVNICGKRKWLTVTT